MMYNNASQLKWQDYDTFYGIRKKIFERTIDVFSPFRWNRSVSFNVWSFPVTWKEILYHVKNLWLHVWHRLTFFQKDIFHINVIYVDRTIKIYWPWYHFVVCTWKLFPIDLSCVCSSTSNIYLPVFICRLKSDAASFYTKNRRINNLFIGQHCLNSFILEQKIVCK